MTDYMNDEQYRKACRYRMQETLENLAEVWQVPDAEISGELIATSLNWLETMAGELRYFDEKIATTNPRDTRDRS